MSTTPSETPFEVQRGGLTLRGSSAGPAESSPPVLALHGLTATRRYVFHGSRSVERAGHRLIAYDARGHGESDPAPDRTAYTYAELAGDTVAVLDALAIEQAVLVGHSMGAHTAARVAITRPDRVAALVLGGPAHWGRPSDNLTRWDALADGLERGGPEGMLAAYEPITAPEAMRDSIRTVILQRLGRHTYPAAVADALRYTPRSAAFDGLNALSAITCPTIVVGTRDELDPDHPLEVAEAWAAHIPGANLVVEAPGESPLTWRGSEMSRIVMGLLEG